MAIISTWKPSRLSSSKAESWIPRGSYVNGTVTTSKPAGALKGKGELFIRFDALILPNGVTREFPFPPGIRRRPVRQSRSKRG